MINGLKIRSVSTYDDVGAELLNLNRINFIYGNNGSGKTTISEVIRMSENFEKCELQWQQEEIHKLVYNRNFVEENFKGHSTIKGIFTLGKESAELLEKIDKTKDVIDLHTAALQKIEDRIKLFIIDKNSHKENFEKICWELKSKYNNDFKELLEGYRGSKEKFSQKCYEVADIGKDGEIYSNDELKKRKISLYDSSKIKVEKLSKLNFNIEVENADVFALKIIGKEDIKIAELISRLNISDWVKQGHEHLKDSEDVCPFCQQNLPEKFVGILNEYFNETYMEQIELFTDAIHRYKIEMNGQLSNIRSLKESKLTYINQEKVDKILEIFEAKYSENKLILEQKVREPSRAVNVEKIEHIIIELNQEIDLVNEEIENYNLLIDNAEQEKSKLIDDFWCFISHENKVNYESYKLSLDRINKILSAMEKGKQEKKGHKKNHERALLEYQEQIISVEYSIKEINSLLKSYGFTNFEIAASSEKGNYEIVRNNGENVKETLSEGEKTFITFLYFYQLIKGSNSKESIRQDKIIVLDDPISSLDSNILFIVSNLIRKLIEDIRSNSSDIKQLFIFTHNIYFHKEVSFNKGKGTKKLNDETFWIIRKNDNKSNVEYYLENPIKTSYELLWKELLIAKQGGSVITLQNIMRRIIENYFKFFGNMDIDVQIEAFPEEDRIVCHSMMSWVNDGSHYINEDLFVEAPSEISSKYFKIFEKIFENTGHHAHYKMMIGEEISIDAVSV